MITFPFNRTAILASILLPLVGCALMLPSATPEGKNQVVQISQRYASGGVKTLGKSLANRKPVRPGQWVAAMSQSKTDPNDVVLQIMKVAAVSGRDVTLEIESYSSREAGQRMVMQQQISNFPVTAKTAYTRDEAASVVGDMQIRSAKIMDTEGRVSELPVMALPTNSIASSLVKSNVSTGAIETKPCQSSRYTSSGCLVVPFEMSVLWKSVRGESFAHSDVPIVGFLRSETGENSVDVVGFGESGAQILLR